MKKLFCFGYGYCCDYLGMILQNHGGWEVSGTTRDPLRQEFLLEHNINAHLFNSYKPLSDPARILADTTHLLISTPPGDEGDPTFLAHAQDIARIESLEWVGYLSATAVYGNKFGAWVDENSEISPTSKRGSRRVKAEKQWYSLFDNAQLPLHIFRLAGIYGPGRSALDSVRAGVARRINKPGHAFNRVHVEDIIGVLLSSMRKPEPGEAYNVADDRPSPSHEVISYACDLLEIEPPPLIPFQEADLAPIARSFYNDNKRILNHKIKENLGVTLRYPDFESGLRACLAAEQYALSIEQNYAQ